MRCIVKYLHTVGVTGCPLGGHPFAASAPNPHRKDATGPRPPAACPRWSTEHVAIARALANNPTMALADAPTSNLDTKTGREIIELLTDLNANEGITIICSTHDPKMLNSSQRVYWMRDGSIERVTSGAEATRHI